MPSVVWDVRSALYDLLTEALDVPVFDGPLSRTTLPKTYVLIGSDGGDTGTGEDAQEGMSTQQSWASVSNVGSRNETGEVTCSVWGWGGSTKFPAVRAQVDAVLTTIESTLLTNRKLSSVLTSGWIELGQVSIRERQVDEGAVVRAVCSITFFSRLT